MKPGLADATGGAAGFNNHNPRVGWGIDFMEAPAAVADIGAENNAKLA